MKNFENFIEENFEPRNKRKGLMAKKYIVTANSFDSFTGEALSQPRDEEIDLETNQLFSDCETIWDIHEKYETFWNRMRGGSKTPSELVFVLKITPVK